MSHTRPLSKLSLSLIGSLTASCPLLASEPQGRHEGTEFDTQMMMANGIDTKLSEFFRHAPRFTPGESTVTLTVNGSARGKTTLRFDSDGRLCADRSFQTKAGLVSPPGFKEDIPCFDLKTAWPQTELNLDPGELRVDVVVPAQAIAPTGTVSGNWNQGGFAGMLNYDAQYMDSAGTGVGISFAQLGTEAGFNAGNWIVRSRQTFSRFNGENVLQHQNAYAQRSFDGIRKVLQAGQISLSSSMFGTGQVLGFQMFPEMALQDSRGGPGLVEGIADSQSVVEVRQSGVLIYTTTVPAGPFRLEGFPTLNTRTDLAVTVTGAEGGKRSFNVPAAALLRNGIAPATGLSFGAGKPEQQGSAESPLLATVAAGWSITPGATLNAGALGSTLYRAAAASMDSQPFSTTLLSLKTTMAQDNRHGNKGGLLSASLSQPLTERIGINFNVSQQTEGYRELSDALQADSQNTTARPRRQAGGGVNWSNNLLGTFSLSWARSNNFDGEHADYLRGGWSRQFDRAYLALSLERSTGSGNDKGSRAYLTLNVPFGNSRSVSSYHNTSSKNSRAGMRYSDRSVRDFGWSLSGERDFRSQMSSGSATADWVTPVSQLGASVSRYANINTTWSARASGSAVAHNHGVTLSPYRVGDTFGVAKVGNERGVRLETPAGTAWTDRRGYAVLPSLSGYKRSAIQVDTRSLEKNIDIDNAWHEIEAARGSVSSVNFNVVHTRRVLVDVNVSQAKSLPYGASVFDRDGKFITVVGNNGTVFINDAKNNMKLDVETQGERLCSFTLSLPENAGKGELFETASAQCQ
ncbi:fimbria/pilus outer membrane usher protein (plasmid) [Enterobacter asburiae]|uniref:fimbria/pilus outer membrane usher protein n=1 Tax=Enterobacter asburiae TaxID=61645 RepID=UPI0032AECB70